MDYQLFDADNHYYESEDCFTRHGDEDVKRFVRWVSEGKRRHIMFGNVMQTMVPNPTFNPITKPGAFHARLKQLAEGEGRNLEFSDSSRFGQLEPLPDYYQNRDSRLQVMDEQGLERAFLYPTLAVGVEGLNPDNVEMTYKVFTSFNKWLEEEWGYNYEDRLYSAPAIPVLDPVLATQELDRVLAAGARLIVLRPGPAGGGSPADPSWDPFWQRLNDTGVPVAYHAYGGADTYADAFKLLWQKKGLGDRRYEMNLQGAMVGDRPMLDTAIALVLGNVFGRFPKLRIMCIELGCAWVPYCMHVLDHAGGLLDRHIEAFGQVVTERPSEVFKRHFWVSPFPEEDIAGLIELIGADSVLFGSDWPHAEGNEQPSDFARYLDKVDPEDVRKILHDNALTLLDPRLVSAIADGDTRDQPLAGVRVIELATGVAGPYAGKLLADYGADVIKVEPPSGDEARGLPPFVDGVPDGDASALFLHLNTNKRSVVLDLDRPEGIDRLRSLIAGADICIESSAPGTMDGWGLGFGVLRELNPSLVLTSVTPFGQDGPYCDYHGSEIVFEALGGMNFTRDPEGRPLLLGGRLAQYQGGSVAAMATVAALLHVEDGGPATHVDVAIAASQVASANFGVIYLVGHAYTGRVSTPPKPTGEPPAPSPLGPLPNGAYQCSDGAAMVATLPVWTGRMLKAIDDPELTAIMGDRERMMSPDGGRQVDAIVTAWFAARTRAQAMADGQAAGWPVTSIHSPGELPDDVQFRQRGAVVTVEHPTVGTVSQLGAPFKLRDGWRLRRPAPRLGEHTEQVLAESRRVVDRHAPGHNVERLPLEGVRVLDMTGAWSGPYATLFLADFGAEVIRVENPWIFPAATRGVYPRPSKEMVVASDNLTMAYPDLDPGERPWNRSPMFNWHGRNKRSITLDIRQPSGREMFLRLVDECDVLVENNVARMLDSFDLGYDVLSARNPRLIALRMPACGLTGPYRDHVGFGHSFEGMAGMRSIRGLPGTPPEKSPTSLHMDTAGGPAGALSVLLALRRRRRTGEGVLIDFAQIENLVQQIGEYVIVAARGIEVGPMGNADGVHAPQGAYPCADDRWVVISVGSDAEWEELRTVMGDPDWTRDAAFATVAGRLADADRLDRHLAEWTRGRDRFDVFHGCQAVGIGSAPVYDEADAYADPQLRHRGFFRSMTSAHTGTHEYPAHVIRWSGPALRWESPSPGLGEDNEDVYRRLLGVGDDEYEQLVADGHISLDFLDPQGRSL